MSETKYTPGPWKVTGSLVSNKDAAIANCSLEHLKIAARVEYYNGETRTEQDKANYLKNRLEIEDAEAANANLIAAAPDMFEVIKELYELGMSSGTKGQWFPKVEAAYLKATGN